VRVLPLANGLLWWEKPTGICDLPALEFCFWRSLMAARVIAILVGIGVMVALERLLGFPWYFALLFAVVPYLLVRYIAYFMTERRLIREALEGARDRPVRKRP
jgi:hypothetical protein